jgi:GTP pyrophosphokinase
MSRETEKVENLRKMLLAMVEDIRVIFIKLADRLHNLRTLSFLPEDQRYRIAYETLEVYAPFAHRLGMARIKCELENLAFLYLEPDRYQEILDMVSEGRAAREVYTNEVREVLERELKAQGITAVVSGRPKPIYSIYKKMSTKFKTFDKIYDLIAFRVITESISDCYAALGIIHSIWSPLPGRFKDYIAVPKSNMYQALHTTVLGPKNRPIEVQIKTHEMHRIAEEGIAAHWRYKEGTSPEKGFDEKIAWLRRILEWQQDLKDPREFMEGLRVELFSDEVFCFTPKGEVKKLPKGSTPIDFAYAVHSEVGDHCAGAKVNGRIVPLRYKLTSGEVVEILTSVHASPREDWLMIVRTGKARARIRRALKLRFEDRRREQETRRRRDEDTRKRVVKKKSVQGGVRVSGIDGIFTRLAKCCSPIPGDEIIGYVTQGRGVSIHRSSCPNIHRFQDVSGRTIDASWSLEQNATYEVGISAFAHDRVGLLQDILQVISQQGAIINQASARATGDGMAECSFTVLLENRDELVRLIREMERVKSVIKVERSYPH